MTKRSPRRPENRIPGAGADRVRPGKVIPTHQKPEKPELQIVEPQLWENTMQMLAAPGKRRSESVERSASEPGLRADMFSERPKSGPQQRQRYSERQLRLGMPGRKASSKKLEQRKIPGLSADILRRHARTIHTAEELQRQNKMAHEAEARTLLPVTAQTAPERPQQAARPEQPAPARPQQAARPEQPASVRPQQAARPERPAPARPQQAARPEQPAPARPQQPVRPERPAPERPQQAARPERPAPERPQQPVRPERPAPERPQQAARPEQVAPERPRKEDSSRRRTDAQNSKKVFSKAFKRGFLISWIIVVVLILAALGILWTRLKKYENGLPDHTIAAICDEIAKGSIGELHPEAADGRALTDESLFVDESSISDTLRKKNEETPLSYVKVNAESGENQNVYMIRSGDQELVKVYLQKASEDEGWKETKTVLSGSDFAVRNLSAQIPSDGTLLLGETEIPRTFVSEEGAKISLLSNLIDAGIIDDAPTLDTYTVEGIFPDIQVRMKTKDGKTVSCSQTDDVYIAGFEADEAFAEEQKDHVISMFEPYAKYFSGDAGKDALRKIMLEGSPAYESATAADVSWMQEHDGVSISEERVENIRQYSDDCFSCDIHFLEDIYQNDEVVRTWDTNMTWVLVKDGDDYYIADFVTKTEA